MKFKDWLQEMAQIGFGKFVNSDHRNLPRHYAQWMADQIKAGKGNFNITDNGRKLSPNEILAALKQSHGIDASQTPSVNQPQNVPLNKPQPVPSSNAAQWIWAKSIAERPDYQMPAAGLNLAMKQQDDNSWMFVILDPEENRLVTRGTIPIFDLKNVVKSERDANGQPVKGNKPSDILKAIMPKKEKGGNTIPDENLSDEQKAIEEKFVQMLNSPDQNHMMINALAGSGKTSILKHLAWKYSKGKKWLYLVFGSKNKEEAKDEFPPNVQVETTNGWAGREVLGKNNIKPTDRIQDYSLSKKADIIADSDGFKNMMKSLGFIDPTEEYGDPKSLGRTEKNLWYIFRKINAEFKKEVVKLLGLAKSFAVDPNKPESLDENLQKVMDQYDLNTDLEASKENISKNSPWATSYIDQAFGFNFLSKDFAEELKKATTWMLHQVLPHASQETFTSDAGRFKGTEQKLGTTRDFDDDLWFSAIHKDLLKFPKYEVVFSDEVQDFNEAQRILLEKLAENGAKIVAVGDPNQCVIEGTQILVGEDYVPVEHLKENEFISAACGHSQIIDSEIKNIYKKYVEDKNLIKITTKKGFVLTTTPDHTHFASYLDDNKPLVFVYLMYREEMGYRIGITKKQKKVSSRLNQERGDKLWLLEVFDSEQEARLYEQFYSVKYGIPTWVFNADGRPNMCYDNNTVKRLFKMHNTELGAFKILNDKEMFLSHPHVIPKCMSRKRYRNFNITLCGDSRQKSLHRYAIAGSEEQDCSLLTELNLKTRKAKRGWRIESCHSGMGEIYSILETIKKEIKVNVIEKARFTDETLLFTPASHVRKGMAIFVQENNKIVLDEVISTEIIKYTGYVYDLNIDRYHNFIANNIVTHNSIYRFRGTNANSFAGISNMLEKGSKDKNVVQNLTKNFRSRKAIIDFVNQKTHVKNLIQGKSFKNGPGRIGEGKATEGEVSYDDAFENLKQEIKDMGEVKQTAFLARTNEPLVHASLKLLAESIPFIILGKDLANDLLKHIDRITDLFGRDIRKDSAVIELKQKIDEYHHDQQDQHFGKAAKAAKLKELTEITEAISAAIDQFAKEKNDGGASSILEFKGWLRNKFGGLDMEKGGLAGKQAREEYKRQVEELNPVILSTTHKAKGMQFQRVYVLRSDLWPHPRSKRPEDIEEEMKNYFVTNSRAEDENHILKLKGQPGYKDPQN